MRIFESEYRRSPISRLDPAFRLATAFTFAVLAALLTSWWALLSSAVIVILLVIIARALTTATWRRLGALNGFVVFLIVSMPLSMPGAPLLQAGSLQWSLDGLIAALAIGAKANLIILTTSALLCNMEPSDLVHALYRLRTPSKLAFAFYFCVRYLEIAHVQYHKLRNAMKLRAYRANFSRKSLRSMGYMIGALFVLSIDRADRILEAMKCRGFDGKLYSLSTNRPGIRDVCFVCLAILCASIVVAVEAIS